MTSKFIIKTSFRALRIHKMRSLLTTLGIIVGIVAIITVMSIGQGAKSKIKNSIEQMGTNFVIVIAGTSKGGPIMQPKTFKQSDFEAVVSECDQIDQISPLAFSPSIKIVYQNISWSTNLNGANSNYADIRNWETTDGSFFTPSDVERSAKVVVIGKTVAEKVFGSENPIGKTIRIKNIPLKVIGILSEKGKRPNGVDEDDVVIAPLSTVQRKILGTFNFPVMIIAGKEKDKLGELADEIKSVLRLEHKLAEKDEEDFTIFTQNDIAQAVDAAQMVLNLLLLAVASISLLVGGIGIMNIMMVTVTERTREIGIRMALGAPTHTILRQFVVESIIMCLAGGIVGVFVGINLSELLSLVFGWTMFISYPSIFISLCASVLIGLFFGFYPAYQASKLNPVEALAER